MDNVQGLAGQVGDCAQVSFRQLGDGVVVADVDNSHGVATISLYGGHVLSWQPKHQAEPVLWVSKRVQYKVGKAIRGGVPICWPWFGSHPSNPKLPGHGYARVSPWELVSAWTLDGGATEIMLRLMPTDSSNADGSSSMRLSLRVLVGAALEIALTTTNEGDQPVVFSEGLHTYFKVGDVTNLSVLGLDGGEYVDLLRDGQRCVQQGAIQFDAELGRIYVNNEATCVIEDPILQRRIRVEKTGSCSTAVWNPWTATAGKMDDLGADGWQDMVCVESANALENRITLPAGTSHTLMVTYSAENLSK